MSKEISEYTITAKLLNTYEIKVMATDPASALASLDEWVAEDFEDFDGERGIGWFTPNKEYAENYTRETGKLLSVYLSIKNPYILNISPQTEMTIEDFIKETGIDKKEIKIEL